MAKATTAKKQAPAKAPALADVLRELERNASKSYRADMSKRYGIVTKDKTLGVPMSKLNLIAKSIGRDHALADELWRTNIYDARMLATLVDDPAAVTPAQMDRWAKGFDNWAIVDTVCFKLFDKSPHALSRIDKWAKAKDEFVKRAAFALLASAALHKTIDDKDILARMPLIERGAEDERNFVKKGVSWALRGIGAKKSPALRAAARKLAAKLAASENSAQRWVGKDALREFERKGK